MFRRRSPGAGLAVGGDANPRGAAFNKQFTSQLAATSPVSSTWTTTRWSPRTPARC
jgi:hypothetical protein